MERVKSNYHTLHVVKIAKPRLCKAIISKCNRDILISIFECGLNVLRCDVKLSGRDKGALQKHKAILPKVAGKSVLLAANKIMIVQGAWRIFSSPLNRCFTNPCKS
jgi:hypothetical protein